jgi:hypothetical protein
MGKARSSWRYQLRRIVLAQETQSEAEAETFWSLQCAEFSLIMQRGPNPPEVNHETGDKPSDCCRGPRKRSQ